MRYSGQIKIAVKKIFLIVKKIFTASLEDNLVVSYKPKHTLAMESNNEIPCYFSKGVEN